MHSESKRIPQANNVIRRSHPAHTYSFIWESMRAIKQTGFVTFSFEEVTWAPSAHFHVWVLALLELFVGKAHMKALEGWLFKIEFGVRREVDFENWKA